jgi:hypothetical protein
MQVVIHPIFIECKRYTLDSEWTKIFDDCAANKFPNDCSFDPKERVMILNEKKVSIPDTFPDAFVVIKNCLKEKLSKGDAQQSEDDTECEWKNVRKTRREHLLFEYAETLKKQYDLSDVEVKRLWAKIMLGLQFHSLNTSDIEFSDGKIQKINGLEFDEKKREFIIPAAKTIIVKENTQRTAPNKSRLMTSADDFAKNYSKRPFK